MMKMPGILSAAVLLLMIVAMPARAEDAWVATHTLYHGSIVQSADIVRQTLPRAHFDAIPADRDIVGLEVKQSIYANRIITEHDVGRPSLVKVNSVVKVEWDATGIVLQMQGRALDSGAMGDDVRVLNTATSRTIHGTVVGEDLVKVQNVP